MTDWPIVRVADVADLKVGFPFKSAGYVKNDGVRLLRGDNVIQQDIRWDAAAFWSASDVAPYSDYLLDEGDIVVAMDRPWIAAGLKVAEVRSEDVPSLLVQRVTRVRAKPMVHPKFLCAVLYGAAFTSWLKANDTGTTVPHITKTDIADFAFKLPPLDEQERIAGVLGAFDDLIETNQRLAASVRQLATASYERALDAVTASRPLRDIADHRPGKYLKKSTYAEGGEYTVYGSNSVMGHHDEYLYEGPLTVLARIGSNCGALRLSLAPAWVNNNASAIIAKDPALQFRLHEALLRIEMDHHSTGSGQPFIRTDSLMEELVPWDGRVTEWDRAAKAMLSTVGEIEAETGNLIRQRDELLPLLMSGRVRVRDLEAMA